MEMLERGDGEGESGEERCEREMRWILGRLGVGD